MINCNLRLVISIAKRYQGHELCLVDLIQEGVLGLIHATEKFDHRHGYRFSSYATFWVRQAVERGLANQAHTIRIPVHSASASARSAASSASCRSSSGGTRLTTKSRQGPSSPWMRCGTYA